MRPVSLVLALCLAGHLHAAPTNTGAGLESIEQQHHQETLETLHLGEPGSDVTAIRDKRTIGPLRQLFPGLSQIVDRKIQQITRALFRVIGRLVLGGGGAATPSASGGASVSSSGSSGRKVSITLPTYPPGEDDEDEEDEDSTPAASTDAPADAGAAFASASASASASSGDESSTPADTENQLSGAESQISEVRVQLNEKPEEQDKEDLKAAASGDNLADSDQARDLENEAEATGDDENRNKRFLPFNLNGGGSGSGSGGGSGNFLFDIIRLIAGSGTTQERDEAENAPLDGSTSSAGASASSGSSSGASEGKEDGYTEGVPGPITRLFVIANRGIANLVQDLILRLAQTSERLVNFKARLITSII